MRSSLWGWFTIVSFSKNTILSFRAFNSHAIELVGEPSIVMTWRACSLRAGLEISHSVNPPVMVLRVWRTDQPLPPLFGALPFLDLGYLMNLIPRLDSPNPLGDDFDIFLHITFLDVALYLFFELVTILYLMSIDLMKFAPTMRIKTHDNHLWSWRLRDIMYMQNLSLYLLLAYI